MKRKDIVLILAIAVVSGIFSLILGHLVFASPQNRQQKVEVVDAISTDFTSPDSKYFNTQSINPTQLIQISNNVNNAPFSTNSR